MTFSKVGMGQKISGGIASAARFGGTEALPGPSNGSPRNVGNLLLPENYRRALELSASPGVDLLQDLVRPYRLDVILMSPPPSDEVLEAHAWNPDDRSLNIYVKEDDKLTFHRHPVAQSTDCIRGRVGHGRGFHVWQVTWPVRQRGTHAVVGVATAEAALHSAGYSALCGGDVQMQSWGWDIGRLRLCHDVKQQHGAASAAKPMATYPRFFFDESSSSSANAASTSREASPRRPNVSRTSQSEADREPFAVPETFLVILDMDEGTLAYCVGDQYLGVAFRGLKGKKLFPIVSCVWGHCEVTMRYLGGLDPEPLPLTDICRRAIRRHIYNTNKIDELNLPHSLKQFLLYQ